MFIKKAVIQAEENNRITQNKYNNALVNTTDLLDANLLLLQSKINLAVAKADVLLAYSKLLETAGILSTNQ
jgi:outer membrane protein TolC